MGLNVVGAGLDYPLEGSNRGPEAVRPVLVDLGHGEPQRRLPLGIAGGVRGLRQDVDQTFRASRRLARLPQGFGRRGAVRPQLESPFEILDRAGHHLTRFAPSCQAHGRAAYQQCRRLLRRRGQGRLASQRLDPRPGIGVRLRQAGQPPHGRQVLGHPPQDASICGHRLRVLAGLEHLRQAKLPFRRDRRIRFELREAGVHLPEDGLVSPPTGRLGEAAQGVRVVGRERKDLFVGVGPLPGCADAIDLLHARELTQRRQLRGWFHERFRLSGVDTRQGRRVPRARVEVLEREQRGARVRCRERFEARDGAFVVMDVVAPELALPHQDAGPSPLVRGRLRFASEVVQDLRPLSGALEDPGEGQRRGTVPRHLGEGLAIKFDRLDVAVEVLLVELTDAIRGEGPPGGRLQTGQVLLEQQCQLVVLARLPQQAHEGGEGRAMRGRQLERLPIIGDRFLRFAHLSLAELAHLDEQGHSRAFVCGGIELAPVHLQQVIPLPGAVVNSPEAGQRRYEAGIDLQGLEEALLGRGLVADLLVQIVPARWSSPRTRSISCVSSASRSRHETSLSYCSVFSRTR